LGALRPADIENNLIIFLHLYGTGSATRENAIIATFTQDSQT